MTTRTGGPTVQRIAAFEGRGPRADRPSVSSRRGPPTRVPSAGRGAEGGFVLIAALWLLVALGAVGLHAGIEMRTERLAGGPAQ